MFGRHYRKYWKTLAAGYLSLFAGIGAAALAPWPLKLIIDHVLLGHPLPRTLSFLNWGEADQGVEPTSLLLLLSLAIVFLALLHSFFRYINKFLVSSTGARITGDVRERVFAHLQRLSLTFHESTRSGNLVYLLTSDVNRMKEILVAFPHDCAHRLGLIAIYSVLMLALDWRLGLIALAALPLFYVCTLAFAAGMKKLMRKRRRREGEVAAIIDENVSTMALVQAYGLEESELGRFQEGSRRSLKAALRGLHLEKTFNRIGHFLVTLSTAAVLYFGGRYALAGEVTAGTLVLFVVYLHEIFGAAEKLGGVFLKLAAAQVSGERLLELVENDMVVEDKPGAISASRLNGRIEFNNVAFGYDARKEVLKDVSFVIEPGETVALVGPSGAGKSTLISLLLRFYDPCRGQVLVDGHRVRQFTVKSLRDQITILLQNAKLFRQSVRDNIAFGKRDATDEEVVDAAKRAGAHEFIMRMPQAYDTLMYEGGDNLSGGQRQCLNIARAIIRNTPIVLLDEPVTGLDAHAQTRVNGAIRELTDGKTTVIVSHSYRHLSDVDRVLVLNRGELVQSGLHEDLLLECPSYQKLLGKARHPAASSAPAVSNTEPYVD